MAEYSYYLANSGSLANIGPLTPIGDTSLTTQVSRSGSLRLMVHTRDEYASQIARVKTCIKVVRDGVTIWSGPVWTRQGDLAAQHMSIGCVGWGEILNYRFLQPSQANNNAMNYQDIDGGLIAFNLLDAANAQGLVLPGAPSTTMIIKGTRQSTLPSGSRKRAYKTWDNVGKEIQALSDIENGFDYDIDPVTRAMNIYYPSMGTDRPEVHFGFQAGPENLQNVTPDEDASRICNRFTALGKITNQYQQVEDVLSMADIGLFEDVQSLSDVSDATILAAFAGEEVAFRTAFTSYTLQPPAGDPSTSDLWIPMLNKDFFLGDTFRFSAKEGPYNFEGQHARCFGAEVIIDTNGNERMNSITTMLS